MARLAGRIRRRRLYPGITAAANWQTEDDHRRPCPRLCADRIPDRRIKGNSAVWTADMSGATADPAYHRWTSLWRKSRSRCRNIQLAPDGAQESEAGAARWSDDRLGVGSRCGRGCTDTCQKQTRGERRTRGIQRQLSGSAEL